MLEQIMTNKYISSFKAWFGRVRLTIVKSILGLIPKDRNLVLFSAWFGKKYADNCMYVYEYLLKNPNYKIYWITKEKTIYNQLIDEGKPVLMWNSLKAKWKEIRAVAVFSSVQFSDYNQWFLSRTIYIDLGHGHPIKDPGKVATDKQILKEQKTLLKFLHYYSVCASDFSKHDYKHVADIPDNHIFISDFARNDAFIYPELREEKNRIVDSFKSGRKAIVYMPSHRSDGKKLFNVHKILPLEEINEFCEVNGWVFIIKKHFYHRNEHEDFSTYKRILDITELNDIDPQTLLYQADILISDYSACYIDFMLLNRPMFFYQFDIDEFQKTERHLYFDFDKLDICPIAYTKAEFIDVFKDICLSPIDKYEEKRQAFLPTYFANPHQENGRGKVVAIMEQLINKYYAK